MNIRENCLIQLVVKIRISQRSIKKDRVPWLYDQTSEI